METDRKNSRYCAVSGCDFVQGYLFSLPMPVEQCDQFLRSSPSWPKTCVSGFGYEGSQQDLTAVFWCDAELRSPNASFKAETLPQTRLA